MKRSSPFRADSEGMTLQMTSMIDVIFLLLIFFVWTSSFYVPEKLLPTPLAAILGNAPMTEAITLPPELADLGEIVIRFHFEKKPYWDIHGTHHDTLDSVLGVLKTLAAQSAEIPVILDIDGNVPMEHIISVYDAARLAGFRRVQFAVSMEKS